MFDYLFTHSVHLHPLTSDCPAGEQEERLDLLSVGAGCPLGLGAEVEFGAAERVVLLGKFVCECSGLVVLDQELGDRPLERVLPGIGHFLGMVEALIPWNA